MSMGQTFYHDRMYSVFSFLKKKSTAIKLFRTTYLYKRKRTLQVRLISLILITQIQYYMKTIK